MSKSKGQTGFLVATGSRLARYLPLLVHLVIWIPYFVYVWSHQFIRTSRGVLAGWIGTWADGAVHLTYASTFAYRDSFPRDLPIYLGRPFTYPFGSDLLTGLATRAGLTIFTAHALLGFVLSAALVLLLYRFYRVLLEDSWAAVVAAALFLLSGGLGFLWFFGDVGERGLAATLSDLPREYTHLGEHHIEWINTISGALVPQRALLLGLPVGLVLVTLIHDLWIRRRRPPTYFLLVCAVLLGLLPVIHAHTFLVVGGLIGFALLAQAAVRRRSGEEGIDWKSWLLVLGPAGLIAVPLVLRFILPATGDGFFRWHPGWLARSSEIGWLRFWILNWGLFLPAAAVGAIWVERPARKILVPFAALFVLANLFLFQPYEFDNAKLLGWVYLVLAAPAAALIVRMLRRRVVERIGASVLLVALSLSGGLDCARLLDHEQLAMPMFSTEELELAGWVRESTPSDAVFLTSDKHNHFVPTLTGRQIVMGYPGWLWTYGISYRKRGQEVRSMYRGHGDRLIDELGVDYVVVGPSEREKYRPNLSYLESGFELVKWTRSYRIYAVDDRRARADLQEQL